MSSRSGQLVDEILAEKARLRRDILRKRDLLSPFMRTQKSLAIMDRLFRLDDFKSAQLLHLFVSFGSEVSTELIIKNSLNMGKRIVVPKIDYKKKGLILSEIIDYNLDLAPGHWGILEPKDEIIRIISPDDLDLILIPGVAFDNAGHRLGYGAGYYDRLLARCNDRPLTIALAYEMQIVNDVPILEYDVKIDGIITEERFLEARSKSIN